MSLSESTGSSAKGGNGFMPHALDRYMPDKLKSEKVEAFFRQPSANLRIGKSKKPFSFTTDRVRAKPAVTPTLSGAVGLFSLGLGMVEFFAPRAFCRFFGMSEKAAPLIQAHGIRELTAGYGIVSGPSDPKWLFARVAGDIVDLATLAPARSHSNPRRGRVKTAMAAVVMITVADAILGSRLMNVNRTCRTEGGR